MAKQKNGKNRFDSDALKQLQGLRLRAQYLVDGFFAGVHQSKRQGSSSEFTELREYSFGDDSRTIDWRVSARRDDVFVRQFEDETNLSCGVLLDCSRSMLYGSRGSVFSKFEYGQILAMTLTRYLLRNHDAVGFATAGTDGLATIEMTTRLDRWVEMVDLAETAVNGGEFRSSLIRDYGCQYLPRRATLFVITDGLFELSQLESDLISVKASESEVILFQILDRNEIDFSFDDQVNFRDLEEGDEIRVDASSLRDAYLNELAEHLESLTEICVATQCTLQSFTTDQSLAEGLIEFREHRRVQNGKKTSLQGRRRL